jgi:predicted GIY-YIG superfamily endonuclease
MSDMPERTAVYHIRGEEGELLYIGMTRSLRTRWNGHAGNQPWWDELRSMTVDWYPSREEADDAERAAIEAEEPKYNKKYLAPRRERQQPARRGRVCMSVNELVALPVEVGIVAAGRALGMGRGGAYKHAKAGTFPFPVQQANGRYTVLKSDLMRFFGIGMDGKPLRVAETHQAGAA